MTNEPNSLSFMETVESKRQQEIISLGKRIADELAGDEHQDILTKWLAHLLAERICGVENESNMQLRVSLQSECCALIMAIWERRTSLPPKARPGGRVREASEAILAMRAETRDMDEWSRRSRERLSSPWFEFAAETYPNERGMAIIAYLTGLLESDLGSEKRWVSENNELLSDDERKWINALDAWLLSTGDLKRFLTGDRSSPTSGNPTDRTARILAKLEELRTQHNEAFAKLRARVLGLPNEHAGSEASEDELDE